MVQPVKLSELQKTLLNDFQQNFPLSPTPYADIANRLGCTEAEVLQLLRELQEIGTISRIGAVFRPNRVGTSTLAAMAVPIEQLETIANYVSSLPEVNHNYEREYEPFPERVEGKPQLLFNLWFVVTASNDEHLQAVLTDIERYSGMSVIKLPLLEDYYINLGFALHWQN